MTCLCPEVGEESGPPGHGDDRGQGRLVADKAYEFEGSVERWRIQITKHDGKETIHDLVGRALRRDQSGDGEAGLKQHALDSSQHVDLGVEDEYLLGRGCLDLLNSHPYDPR